MLWSEDDNLGIHKAVSECISDLGTDILKITADDL